MEKILETNPMQKIVIKVGTRLLTHTNGKLNLKIIEKLVREVANVKNMDKDVVLVSSGAIGAGIGRLGLKKKPVSIQERQACAAIGQGLLIQFYEKLFSEYGHVVAQVLLTREDIESRRRYLNSRNTLLHIFKYGAIPIVNENDTISTEEIEFGDNDKLSALVATLIDADLLILLTTTDGLYTSNPQTDSSAELLQEIEAIDSDIKESAGVTEDMLAKGGMMTKVEAAEVAMASGIDMVIANGYRENIVSEILEGKARATLFHSTRKMMSGKKKWIAFAQKAKGVIIVDEGAEKALREEGKSLLPVGINKVTGNFYRGDTVNIKALDGTDIACGIVNYSAEELKQIMGFKTRDIDNILGYSSNEEVIHRDNLVLYPNLLRKGSL